MTKIYAGRQHAKQADSQLPPAIHTGEKNMGRKEGWLFATLLTSVQRDYHVTIQTQMAVL